MVNWSKQLYPIQRANMEKNIIGIMRDTSGKGAGLTKKETSEKLTEHIDTALEGHGFAKGEAITTEEAINRANRS